MIAKLNLPHKPPLPSFVQAEVWPVSQLSFAGAIPYLGIAMSFDAPSASSFGEKKE